MAETICQGGTCKLDGFESKRTPVDSIVFETVVLADFTPRVATNCWTSAGPPLLTIWGFLGSVTTLALLSAVRTLTRSSLVRRKAKKCWLTWTSLSFTQPRVLPSVLRGEFWLPAAGQEGVETCMTRPSPASFQATIPFEW